MINETKDLLIGTFYLQPSKIKKAYHIYVRKQKIFTKSEPSAKI